MRNHWLTAARLTNAQWLAVSVFEDVIDLPGRISQGPAHGPLGHGSPARYHLPMAPLVLGSVIGAVVSAPTRRARRPILAGAACTGASLVLTGVLIRTVNIPLLEGGVDRQRSAELVARWHALNKVRVALLSLGALAFETAASQKTASSS
jgi:hypothetical protein